MKINKDIEDFYNRLAAQDALHLYHDEQPFDIEYEGYISAEVNLYFVLDNQRFIAICNPYANTVKYIMTDSGTTVEDKDIIEKIKIAASHLLEAGRYLK